MRGYHEDVKRFLRGESDEVRTGDESEVICEERFDVTWILLEECLNEGTV